MTPTEKRERDEADLREVMSTPGGRRFVHRLIAQAGLYSPSYAESPTATAFNEGRRSIAIALMDEAKRVSSELYKRGLRETLDAIERSALAEEAEREKRRADDEA